MMRCTGDREELVRINAEPWQVDLLQLNPSYCSWGPHEDCMWNTGKGWDSRLLFESWSDFGPWELNDFNECVNFYFEVDRESRECPVCGGNGYHERAQQVVRTFYQHSCLHGETPWNTSITEDEAAALVEAGRGKLDNLVTAADFNAAELRGGISGHDAINRHILIRARLDRLDLPNECSECGGHGYVYIAPAAHVSLILWWLHPGKGCSRGIEVKNIDRTDLPAVFVLLSNAAKRNAERFSAVAAQGMSASGQDPQGLEAKPASPLRQDAPETPPENHHGQ